MRWTVAALAGVGVLALASIDGAAGAHHRYQSPDPRLLGVWTLSVAGRTCTVALTGIPAGPGRAATTAGCRDGFAAVERWTGDGEAIGLLGPDSATAALTRISSTRYVGRTPDGTVVALTR